jgi:hypothetical protein
MKVSWLEVANLLLLTLRSWSENPEEADNMKSNVKIARQDY